MINSLKAIIRTSGVIRTVETLEFSEDGAPEVFVYGSLDGYEVGEEAFVYPSWIPNRVARLLSKILS